MKVLYHHRTQAGDAQGIHIRALQKAFQELGVRVYEVSPLGGQKGKVRGGFLAGLAKLAQGPLYEVLELLYNIWAYFQIRRALRKHRPDFLYERYALFTAAGILAARREGVPVILEVNAPLALEKKLYGRLFLKRLAFGLERWICSHADRTLAVTGELKRILAEEGIPPQKLEVMTNGVDADLFTPSRTGSEVRVRYGLEGKTVLGFVGWFRFWHRIDLLLKAFPLLPGEPGGRHILLVGDGPDRSRLESLMKKEGLEPYVTITGGLGRVETADHVAAFDIALEPGVTPYACPMKILEYFASGKPVVAPRLPNIEALVVEGEAGILFEEGDLHSLRKALSFLIRSPERRREMGRRAREIVLERGFLWKRNAQRVLDIYEEIRKNALEGG